MKTLFIAFLGYIVVLFAPMQTIAQDQIILLNGKIKTVGKVREVDGDNLLYQMPNSEKIKKMSWEKIFSVKLKDGTEKVIYYKDSLIDNTMTIAQMRDFIDGQREANKNYHTPLSFVSGVVYGVAGGLVVPAYATLSFIPPGVGTIMNTLLPVNVNKQAVTNDAKLAFPAFVAGYQKRAKEKRLKNTALGSVIGIITTVSVLYISGSLK